MAVNSDADITDYCVVNILVNASRLGGGGQAARAHAGSEQPAITVVSIFLVGIKRRRLCDSEDSSLIPASHYCPPADPLSSSFSRRSLP